MLVLTRKADETIVIEGGITITVVKVGRNVVRIGVDAPDDRRIYRGELLEKDDFQPSATRELASNGNGHHE